MLRKAVDFQKQDLGIPIDLGIQIDLFGNPYTLKISIDGFHSALIATMMFFQMGVYLFFEFPFGIRGVLK